MKQKNLLFRIFLVIFLVAVAGIIGLLVRDHIQKDKDQKLREKAAVSVQEEPEVSAEAEETPVQIPVDFSVLQAENPDIYAWIHIADTPVDYPILQSKVDDDYYMDHTVDDKEGLPGAIMTEYSYNPEPFESDAVTVVYGHNMLNDSSFSRLKDYQDETFRQESILISRSTHRNTFTNTVCSRRSLMTTDIFYTIIIAGRRKAIRHFWILCQRCVSCRPGSKIRCR